MTIYTVFGMRIHYAVAIAILAFTATGVMAQPQVVEEGPPLDFDLRPSEARCLSGWQNVGRLPNGGVVCVQTVFCPDLDTDVDNMGPYVDIGERHRSARFFRPGKGVEIAYTCVYGENPS